MKTCIGIILARHSLVGIGEGNRCVEYFVNIQDETIILKVHIHLKVGPFVALRDD